MRWTRAALGARGAGRAGSPCEPEAAHRRAALSGSSRQRASGKVDKAGKAMRRTCEPCVRQNRVVLAVVATVKLVAEMWSVQPGGPHRQSARRGRPEGIRLPGEHGISRKPTAQGRPSVRPNLYAAVRFLLRYIFAQRTAGARSAPGLSLRPLGFGGQQEDGMTKQSSGETRRESAGPCARRCELDGSDHQA